METIKIGDLVLICYLAGPGVVARLLHEPQEVGDVWEFQEEVTGRIFVQNPYSLELDRWELIKEE